MDIQKHDTSWLLLPASKGVERPPTVSQLQLLPFAELEWENLERLCYRLASAKGDVEDCAVIYGARGQKQDGIDVYVRLTASSRYSCWQSKRHKSFTISVLNRAVREFENGKWVNKSAEFVICTSAPIQDTKLQDAIEVQSQRLRKRAIKLSVLGQTELSTELKERASLVRDFFGREWAKHFCVNIDGIELDNSLDATDIAALRAELHKLYVSNFGVLDPGILSASIGDPGENRPLPLLDRFIEPDIEIAETRRVDNSRANSPAKDTSVPEAGSDKADFREGGSSSTREVRRRRVSAWVAEYDHTILSGDAGLGKSTILRAFALDLLQKGIQFPAVTKKWADYIPIVVPFAFLVRLLEKDDLYESLPAAIGSWFKKFDISPRLLQLIHRSIEEQRSLLLVDGLDEWSNETAARSALALLSTFIKTKSVPAIVTGRPSGLARLGTLDPMWQQGRLGALSDSQQHALPPVPI